MTQWLLGLAALSWLLGIVWLVAAPPRALLTGCAALTTAGGALCATGGGWLLVQSHAVELQPDHHAAVTGTMLLRFHPLAGAFVVLLGLVSIGVGLYQPGYHRGSASRAYLICFQVALLASLAVLVAGNVPTFLVAWETMALSSFLLVLRLHAREGVTSGAFWFLALSEVGFALVTAALVLLAASTGSLDFAVIAARAHEVPDGIRTAAFLLALIGFGFKAGLVPMHVWLPEAHPVAPSDGSAFLSGLIVKLGVYGVLLFVLQLDAVGPTWWGLVVLVLGALSAVIGILYALAERDLKRFLAYSTIENVGIIFTAIGAAMTFRAAGLRGLAALLLIAALFHVGAHGVSKTLLFLEAGVVDHACGTRDMDRLGGLNKRMPVTSAITLIGVMGMAALPPFCGFVSEWLIFEGMFQAFRLPQHAVGVLVVAAAATLALTGGSAVAAFVRFFGIPFLGMPRTRRAAEAIEDGQPVIGAAFLATVIAALGIGAPVALLGLAKTVRATTGEWIVPHLLPGRLTVTPAADNFAAFSPTYLAVFLVLVSLIPIGLCAVSRTPAAKTVVPVWDGGIREFKPRLQYSAMTFSAPTRVMFAGLYRPHVHLERASDDPAGRSGPVHYESAVTPIFITYLYAPVIRTARWLAKLVRPIQSGDVNLYLLYVFLVVIAAYVVAWA